MPSRRAAAVPSGEDHAGGIFDPFAGHDIVDDQVDARKVARVSDRVVVAIIDFPDLAGGLMPNIFTDLELDARIGDDGHVIPV